MTQNGITKKENDYFEYLKKCIDGMQGSTTFYRTATALIPIAATENSVTCEITVANEHVNEKGTMHGGQTVTLVDILTARAVGMTVRDMPMVSVDLSCSFMLPIPVGEIVVMHAEVLKKGRTMAFTECEFRRKSDNKLLAKGKHNLALLPYMKVADPSLIRQF
uniref:Acyl-coenzyme A thioesterase 13 n=1 Tax=Panagrolaimus superbus TaxID=310955 RepID=A0A914XU07_9BILA